jgi:hypothetical protein
MAFFDSQLSVFQIKDTGGTLRDITPYIVSCDGLPGPRELSEATTLNDTSRKWHPSLENPVITLELIWSDDANVGADTVLGPLRAHNAAVDFDYGPEGKTAGDVKYSGTAWVRNYTIISRIGDLVRSRCELQCNSVITRGTY